MTIAEVNTAYEPKKVITFAKDGNTVIKPIRNVKQICGSIYSTEPRDEGYYYKPVKLFAFYGDNIGIEIANADTETELDKIEQGTENIKTFDGYISNIKRRIEANTWINLAELEYLKAYKPELIAGAEKARAIWKAKQDERRRQEEAERTAREQAEHDAENAKSFEKINKAIEVFKTSGRIENDEITVWTSPDDYKDYTVITYLLDKYGIKCPIKTRGYIINSICTVKVNEDYSISYSRLNKTISNKAFEVLGELRDIIRCGGMDTNKAAESIAENIFSFEGYAG